MNRVLTSRRTRWALPAVVAAALATAAITTTGGAGASERPNLPPKTAAQLLAAVEQAHPQALSGTIVETTHLGLPTLPGSDSAGSGTSLQSLLTGSHTLRIWYGGPSRQRLALLAPLAERDVVHNGTDLWTYTSTTNEVTHSTVRRNLPTANPSMLGLTPQQAAREALAAIDPTTSVTVDLTARVAGRAAYQLDLTPNDPRSLVRTVRIAIDAATSVPLRLQVFGAGTVPAIEVGFTDISFGAPNPSVFRFVPPSGATVNPNSSTEGDSSGESPDSKPGAAQPGAAQPGAAQPGTVPAPTGKPTPATGTAADHGPVQLGDGWTTVVEFPGAVQAGRGPGYLLDKVATVVPGGRLVKTALLSVLVTDNGDLYVGPVSGADLQRVAATGKGL